MVICMWYDYICGKLIETTGKLFQWSPIKNRQKLIAFLCTSNNRSKEYNGKNLTIIIAATKDKKC